jgi:hypothetical protein
MGDQITRRYLEQTWTDHGIFREGDEVANLASWLVAFWGVATGKV